MKGKEVRGHDLEKPEKAQEETVSCRKDCET